jgi:hypothetical protein
VQHSKLAPAGPSWVRLGHSAMSARCPICSKADKAGRFMSTRPSSVGLPRSAAGLRLICQTSGPFFVFAIKACRSLSVHTEARHGLLARGFKYNCSRMCRGFGLMTVINASLTVTPACGLIGATSPLRTRCNRLASAPSRVSSHTRGSSAFGGQKTPRRRGSY